MRHPFEALSGQIIEAALHAHKELGPGYSQSIYENASKAMLGQPGVAFELQSNVRGFFDRKEVGCHRLDRIVDRQVIVELKAVKVLEERHFAQVRSYARANRPASWSADELQFLHLRREKSRPLIGALRSICRSRAGHC